MSASVPTRGQIERELSQQLQALYREHLGHRPGKITCQLSDEKVIIVVEDAVTQPEKLLVDDGREELAEQVRADLEQAIRPRLIELIEKVLKVSVIDLLSDATLETGYSGIIAILQQAPETRTPASKRRSPYPQNSDSSSD